VYLNSCEPVQIVQGVLKGNKNMVGDDLTNCKRLYRILLKELCKSEYAFKIFVGTKRHKVGGVVHPKNFIMKGTALK